MLVKVLDGKYGVELKLTFIKGNMFTCNWLEANDLCLVKRYFNSHVSGVILLELWDTGVSSQVVN